MMEENQQDTHGMNSNIHELGDTLKPTTYQIYKAIDWDSNIFTTDVDGKMTTCIGIEYGNLLYKIEEFVEAIIKGEKAFSTELNKRGCMKHLALAKYFDMVDAFLALHSANKAYSLHVELFFATFVIKHGLTHGDLGRNPDAYSPQFKKKQGEVFNQLIGEISAMASQRAFKRKLYARAEAISRGRTSGKEYIDALYARYARLLVLRIDFGFRTETPLLPHPVSLQEAQEHLARFFNNKRGKKLYASLKGYIWRLEYGKEKGYHFHLFFFFDGSRVHKDEFLASEIGNDWIKVTEGKGIFHNCNAHKQKYKRLGIGMISHDDEEKRRNLLDVLAYLYKQNQILREKYADKTHGWGRGTKPSARQRAIGRPRQTGTSD
jgi:hypothetical protein